MNFFEGHLPPGVTWMPEDTIGTLSGNPSSDVTYGFHDSCEQPHFARVELAQDTATEQRWVRVVGRLTQMEYLAAQALVGYAPPDQSKLRAQEDTAITIMAIIPRNTHSEEVIGGLLFAALHQTG